MYKNILENIYNNELNLFSTTKLETILTSIIFEYFENDLFIYKLYDDISKILNNDIIISGDVAMQIFLKNKIHGCLNIEIPMEENKYKNLVNNFKIDVEYMHLNNIFPKLNIINFNNIILSNINKYYNIINHKINNINLDNILPEKIKLNNNFYIADSYIDKYYEIPNNNIKINIYNTLESNIELSYDSEYILIKYFLPIVIQCDNNVYQNTEIINGRDLLSKFIFLKIYIKKISSDSKIVRNINNYNLITYNDNHILNEQISTLISKYILTYNCEENINNIVLFIEKLKNTYIKFPNIKSNKKRKVLFSRYINIFKDNMPIHDYFMFKYCVLHKMFIYRLDNIPSFGYHESQILQSIPDYVENRNNNIISIIDNILYNNINFVLYHKKINIKAEEFNLSNEDIINIKNNNILNELLKNDIN
ncbi:unknown similar to AMEV033 [Mythimna separata entomopoxvirus 'L']|uniref:Uncharacterized protein n=1 Tax=Mythimna separata entomopoxvirus 'L' TaxID=1293572 RepID=A0A916KQ10_9POXV|nr:unknown similar to AMEV033 [Mythimna separata entomopoxvirus 'L']CCU56263.1 unknown similar to AMEV033 [Mythimna separata entomopoxvirus 'L']